MWVQPVSARYWLGEVKYHSNLRRPHYALNADASRSDSELTRADHTDYTSTHDFSTVSNGYTRRATFAAVIAAGVSGLSLSDARGLLESFAPLSGTAWDAAGRDRSESVVSPHGEATMRLDNNGIPHVKADDEAAAYFAVGYCHGFDRPFQLNLQRRAMRGRLRHDGFCGCKPLPLVELPKLNTMSASTLQTWFGTPMSRAA